MKECKHCGEEMKEKAKICPNCKRKQTNPLIKFCIIVIVIVGLIAGCSSLFSDAAKEVEKENKKEKENFTYEVTKEYAGDYNIGYYVEGTVKNGNNKEYSYVQIEFSCYDKDGNNLGSALDNMNNLGANETWKFKATYLDNEKVDHCTYKDITVW